MESKGTDPIEDPRIKKINEVLLGFANDMEQEDQLYKRKIKELDEIWNADGVLIKKAQKIAEARIPFLHDEFEDERKSKLV